jgi:hypothetical protein
VIRLGKLLISDLHRFFANFSIKRGKSKKSWQWWPPNPRLWTNDFLIYESTLDIPRIAAWRYICLLW